MADAKISALTETVSPASTDNMAVVQGMLTTPTTKRFSLSTLTTYLASVLFPLADSNLSQITTASKVSGTAITGLASLPSGAGVIPAANLPVAASITRGTFVNADLSAGVLTITHGKGLSSPYTISITVFNNTPTLIIPDAVNTLATNSFKVDLTSYGAIAGTWSYAYST